MNKRNSRYPVFVLSAGALWGLMGCFVKVITAFGITSLQLAVYRGGVATVLFIVYDLLVDVRLLKIGFRNMLLLMLMGVCSVAVFNISYFTAISLLQSISVASVLVYTSPAFVMVFSIPLFREAMTLQKFLALCLTAAGCIFVSGFSQGAVLSLEGIILGLASGFGYAMYSLLGKIALKHLAPFTVMTYTFLFGTLFCLPFVNVNELVEAVHGGKEVLWILAFGLVCCFLPMCCIPMDLRICSHPKRRYWLRWNRPWLL